MNYYLLKPLKLSPLAIERIVGAIEESRFDDRRDPERFTIREAIAHIADFEPIFRERMELAVKAPGTPIVMRDEEQMAIDNDYAHQDVHENVVRFKDERSKTVAFLTGLTPADFECLMRHPELGPLTVEDIANVLLGHDLYHVEHVTQYLS